MGKQLLHGEKGRTTAKTHPESAFGWVLIGWVLRSSLSFLGCWNGVGFGREKKH